MTELHRYTLLIPKRWRAGYVGSGETKREAFFSCAGCATKEPEIAGFIGDASATLEGVAVLPVEGSAFRSLALYCAPCWKPAETAEGMPNRWPNAASSEPKRCDDCNGILNDKGECPVAGDLAKLSAMGFGNS